MTSSSLITQPTQTICITFIQCWWAGVVTLVQHCLNVIQMFCVCWACLWWVSFDPFSTGIDFRGSESDIKSRSPHWKNYHARPNSRICLLYNRADTVLCLRMAMLMSRLSLHGHQFCRSKSNSGIWWKLTITVVSLCVSGSVSSYKLRYTVGFGLVEIAISTNPKLAIYCSSYENTGAVIRTVKWRQKTVTYEPRANSSNWLLVK